MSVANTSDHPLQAEHMSPSMFSIVGLPRPFFRDPYLVVSVWQPSPTTWRAEYYILTKRPHEQLVSKSFDWDPTTFPPDEPPVDEIYMVEEAKRRAEIDLIEETDKLAQEQHDPALALEPTSFKPSTTTLGFLWRQGTYRAKISEMESVSKSPRLRLHLGIVMNLRMMGRA